jgi:MurNAc alpha-1-phosphate uridylyltransferase
MLKAAARAGRLAGSLYEGLWEDVGTPERLAELNRP